MARRRSISTDISTDPKLAGLAEHGPLPMLLYTWAIPHADDWGRLPGDALQFKLLICPALTVTVAEIDAALDLVSASGLWQRYAVEGSTFIAFPSGCWFKHQSYIPQNKRDNDKSQYPPQITAVPRSSPQNPVSPSLTPTPSLTENVAPTELERAREKTDPPSPKPPKPVPKPQATRVPDDFLVTEPLRQLAIKTGMPPESIEEETDKFLDHFRSNGKTMVDWTAAWRNWMRRATEFKPQVRGSPVTRFPTVAEQNAVAFATVRKAMGLNPEPAMNMIDVEVKPR